MSDFHGAKLAILVGDRIVTILRDDLPTIPWPAHWDLPGGAREHGETPEACVLRELREELGIGLPEAALHWRLKSRSPLDGHVWFFVSEQPDFDPETVRFGSEGQLWDLVSIGWYLTEARVVPQHRARLKTYLDQHPDRL